MIAYLGITISVMMIPIGIILGATKSIATEWVWLIGIIGFGGLIWALIRARQEDKEREYRTRLFEAFVSKMGVDVEKIRKKQR